MLLARGYKEVGEGKLRWALLFATAHWSIVFERRGLVLDTQFVPAATAPPSSRRCLYMLLEGSWLVRDRAGATSARFEGPCLLLTTEEHLEGASGERSMTFRAQGRPYRAIELHLDDRDVVPRCGERPTRLEAPEAVFVAARGVAHLSDHSDESLVPAFAAFVAALAEHRFVDAKVAEAASRPESRSFRALWAGLRPMIERLYLNPTLQELGAATHVSTRQLDRWVQRFVTTFGLVGTRWRTTTLHFRLKLAIILLSAEGATVSDVARAVGYGSSDALGRMFRDAGLPTPVVVQRAVREASLT